MNIDDLLDKMNWINKLHGVLWTVTSYLPHRRSHKGRKVGPWRVDGGTRRIEIDRRAHSGAEVERILQRAHIPIGGRGITSKTAHFLVRSRQYRWALYVLLRAGVVVASPVPGDVARWAGGQVGAVPMWGSGERGLGNGERGTGNGERGAGTGTGRTRTRIRVRVR